MAAVVVGALLVCKRSCSWSCSRNSTGHGNYNTAISNHATDPTIRKDLELERDQQGVRGLGCMRFLLVTVWIPGIKTYAPSVCLQLQSVTE